MEILEPKNYYNQNKKINGKVQQEMNRVNKFKVRTETIQSKQKKTNVHNKGPGVQIKDVTFISLEFQKKGRKRAGLKKNLNNG